MHIIFAERLFFFEITNLFDHFLLKCDLRNYVAKNNLNLVFWELEIEKRFLHKIKHLICCCTHEIYLQFPNCSYVLNKSRNTGIAQKFSCD